MEEKGLQRASTVDLRMLSKLLAYQYDFHPREVYDVLKGKEVMLKYSLTTGRMRHVVVDGRIALTIRANDGFLVFTPWGVKVFEKIIRSYFVVVDEEVGRYIADGRTLFSKHVLWADERILPGDEIFVKCGENIVALAKAVLPGKVMGRVKRGKAAKTRKGVKN